MNIYIYIYIYIYIFIQDRNYTLTYSNCMGVKLLPEKLNPGSYPPHSTSTYTYGVTIASRVYEYINMFELDLFNIRV